MSFEFGDSMIHSSGSKMESSGSSCGCSSGYHSKSMDARLKARKKSSKKPLKKRTRKTSKKRKTKKRTSKKRVSKKSSNKKRSSSKVRIGPLRKGTLRNHGYSTTESAQKRHIALNKAIKAHGPLIVFRKLNAVWVLNRNRSPDVARKFKSDRDWVHKKMGK